MPVTNSRAHLAGSNRIIVIVTICPIVTPVRVSGSIHYWSSVKSSIKKLTLPIQSLITELKYLVVFAF